MCTKQQGGPLRVHRSHSILNVATYPSAGGRREAHGCVFQGREICGVATNVYLRKTSKKPKEGLRILRIKGSGVFYAQGSY